MASDNLSETPVLCACGCGKPTTLAKINHARSGAVKGQPNRYLNHHQSARHGASRNRKLTPEYRTWRAMRQRCTDPNAINYKHYGGRGITICECWDSFENFHSPANCKWATRAEQAKNKRRNLSGKGGSA
jgi:hypothetical protein